ncbi:hydroxymethylpyrimidine/phosphomethylpyrimidine kinase [bacterium]|nr:hydroxymethylpyrimidine/phosphomethylpyrimidine kinase [candidate division CSSED10-310 bacterium]
MRYPPVVAVLSGLDPTGGAGLLADIRALTAAGVRIAPMLTANTIQGRDVIAEYQAIDSSFLARQLDSIDRLFRPSAMKIGMIGSPAIADVIKKFLRRTSMQVVLDPVMKASSGGLLSTDCLRVNILELAGYVTVLTPNRDELAWLSGMDVQSDQDLIDAVAVLRRKGFRAVYVKGGHFDGDPKDVLIENERVRAEYIGPRMKNKVRGTGCHLAAFMAGELAIGYRLEDACRLAYQYVQSMLIDYVGAGNGILPADVPVEAFTHPGYNKEHDE